MTSRLNSPFGRKMVPEFTEGLEDRRGGRVSSYECRDYYRDPAYVPLEPFLTMFEKLEDQWVESFGRLSPPFDEAQKPPIVVNWGKY